MAESLLQVLSWAIHSLGLERVGVRVRSDNPALGFYQKVGFVELKRVGLRISRDADMIRWIEDASLANQEVSLVHMILNHDALTRLD